MCGQSAVLNFTQIGPCAEQAGIRDAVLSSPIVVHMKGVVHENCYFVVASMIPGTRGTRSFTRNWSYIHASGIR